MSGLADLDLKFKYRSNEDILYRDFYKKCLEVSTRYDRAVGYFTSTSLSLLGEGLERFINNNGKIRIVANPLLEEEDYKAILRGERAKESIIEKALLRQINICQDTIKNDSLGTLACLISEGKLEIKIAFSNDNILYHEKFGIFYDDFDNKVGFSGSANETFNALVNNFEKIDVYKNTNELYRINDMIADFEKLWLNKTKKLTVVNIPNAVLLKFLSFNNDKAKKKKTVEVREYQKNAIKAFKDNQWNGIFEMATGTGKTISSLFVTREYKKEKKRMFLIILVPFTHLVDQWIENCKLFDYKRIIKCYGNKKSWINKLENNVRDFNIGISDLEVAITTYKSASSDEFNCIINRIRKNAFIIGDECHYFGVKSLQNNKFDNIEARLGLSATPDRWWDEDGTENLRSFFGNTVYEYDMNEAIKNGILTEYKYNPIICNLNKKEILEYEKFTRKIQKVSLKSKKRSEDIKRLEELNRKRSLILSKASQKIKRLEEMLNDEDIKNLKHTLVYCAPGDVDKVTKIISDIGIRIHRFDSKVNNRERTKILKKFDSGEIQVLVAIKCLDEGVDIPSTRRAYFLASTSNPREFVQRRGRILRKARGKNLAEIYDFIVIPEFAEYKTYINIIKKEMPRFSEFSKYAINEYSSRQIVNKYLEKVGMEHLMDKLPWDVYKELKEEFEDE
ncbi:DEAD/DEAH box helicase family protein [Clostridium perfringens]|uniref:DEAD/DEAH box helicase family protein n=1 Tax=Clostridium perfringens TaxID=1502 RepID=UPI0022474998|nr:DEAD/DEAH box helicase family protein [Clostridium perfringens]ELC8434700.1 DEAD/DEAH box helicase family protein [Clostridium perfringens]MCX0395267.1 DEAD/DEAH box helicase family protein [Clostridium perfringens]